MPRQSLNQRANQQQDIEHIKDFIEDFKSETDRAAVILGVAKLDNTLYQIISKVLLPPPSSQDELLDGDSPLSTFSSRINLAYRLGIIDAEFTRILHLIRKIRNSFAHEITGATLNAGAHTDRIRELSLPLKKYKEYLTIREMFFSGEPNAATDFRTVLTILSVRLSSILSSASEFITINNKAVSLRPNKWVKREAASLKRKEKVKSRKQIKKSNNSR